MEADAFLKMDIFFVVTTGLVILFGIFLAVILYYVVKIVRNISKVVALVEREAVEISDDFKEIRKDVKEGFSDVREGITTATNYTKMVAGAGIVKAVSGLFEAFMEEKEQRTVRKKKRKKNTDV